MVGMEHRSRESVMSVCRTFSGMTSLGRECHFHTQASFLTTTLPLTHIIFDLFVFLFILAPILP